MQVDDIFAHACRQALGQRPLRQGYLLKQGGAWEQRQRTTVPTAAVILTWKSLTYYDDEKAARRAEASGTIYIDRMPGQCKNLVSKVELL